MRPPRSLLSGFSSSATALVAAALMAAAVSALTGARPRFVWMTTPVALMMGAQSGTLQRHDRSHPPRCSMALAIERCPGQQRFACGFQLEAYGPRECFLAEFTAGSDVGQRPPPPRQTEFRASALSCFVLAVEVREVAGVAR